MRKHVNKWLVLGIIVAALGWANAEFRIRDRNHQLQQLNLVDVTIEARDAATDELLKTSIGPPNKVNGFPLLNVSSPDGLKWKVLCASDAPSTFRISSSGYVDGSVTVDGSNTVAVLRLKKI